MDRVKLLDPTQTEGLTAKDETVGVKMRRKTSYRQRLWMCCKGTIYVKLVMLVVKIIIIGLIFYIGVSDEEPSVKIHRTVKPNGAEHPNREQYLLQTCPYADNFKKPKLGVGFKLLLWIKWLITLPLVIVKSIMGLVRERSHVEPSITIYDCELSQWTVEKVFTNLYWSLNENIPTANGIKDKLEKIKYNQIGGVFDEFHPRILFTDLKVLYQLLEVFAYECTRENLTFFLYGDSLLDAYQHHGMAPWRDVINLAVPVANKSRLIEIFKQRQDYNIVLNTASTEAAFHRSSAKAVKRSVYKWPYLMISFYGEDLRQIWDINARFTFSRRYEHSLIFPLNRRPYWNLWLPVPKETLPLVKSSNVGLCTSPTHNHKNASWIPRALIKKVSCSLLYKGIPLVFRKEVAEGTSETLRIDSNTLQTILIVK